ncbi:DUF4400 domain-containing protein [Vibrio navarrensis]|nr:DUF4400 domain-containing protein [Vibrio navarrensis]
MSQEKKSNFWVILFGAVIMPTLLLVSLFYPDFTQENVLIELNQIAVLSGQDEATEIYLDVSETSEKWLVKSGFIDWLREVLLPKEYRELELVKDEKVFTTQFWNNVDKAILGLQLNVEFTLLRIYGIKVWLAVLIVFTTASAVSGYFMREIKKYGFEYSSPMRHGIGRKVIYTLPFSASFYLLAPIALPVYFVPISIFIYSFSIMTIMANTIKRV